MVLQLTTLCTKSDITQFIETNSTNSEHILLLHKPTCKPCNRIKSSLFPELEECSSLICIGTIDAEQYPIFRTVYSNIDSVESVKSTSKSSKVPVKVPYFIVLNDTGDMIASIQDSNVDTIRDFITANTSLRLPIPFHTDVDF